MEAYDSKTGVGLVDSGDKGVLFHPFNSVTTSEYMFNCVGLGDVLVF